MPATITHTQFGNEVMNNLPKNINTANVNLVKTFSNATDPLMFYNVESLKSGKNIQKLQHKFHTEKTQNFFINLVNYIKKYSLTDDKEILSFLYGFIIHYVLDSNMHPYICYKSMCKESEEMTGIKKEKHAYMETYLDNYIIETRFNKKYTQLTKDMFGLTIPKFSNNLNKCIDSVFYQTYKISNIDKYYYTSLKQMKRFLIRYRKDNLGIKKAIYTIANALPGHKNDFKMLSYHYIPKNKEFYLNNNHTIWYYPADETIYSYESFEDIYKRSLDEAVDIIQNVDSYLKNKKINLKKVFTNKNYVTGLDCNKKMVLKKSIK